MSHPCIRILTSCPLRVDLKCCLGLKFMCTTPDVRPASTHPDLFLQVVANGALGVSKSVLLKYRDTKLLFNCGESTETSFKGNVNDVYITHINWENIGGLLNLTFKSISSKKDQLFVCGPPGVDYFMQAAQRFLRVHQSNFKINLLNEHSDFKNLRNNFEISCVVLKSKQTKVYRPPPINKSLLQRTIENKLFMSKLLDRKALNKIELNTSYSYICKTESSRSWDLTECVKRGVKPGENMLKLWQGENVILDDGSLVRPEDVITTHTSPSIIVVDCPTQEYVDDLQKKEDYKEYYKSENSLDVVIIHFTPMAVMNDKRYIEWMLRFPDKTKHLIVNDSNEWNVSTKVLNKHEVCRLISPKFFPELRKSSCTISSDMSSGIIVQGDITVYGRDAEPVCVKEVPTEGWLQKWSDQLKHCQLIQSWWGTCLYLNNLEAERYFTPFAISCPPSSLTEVSTKPSEFFPSNPRITFLGTGSQGSSVYRNASGILVQMSKDKAMLLDCGDGIVKQLATLFDEEELPNVLTSLRCIYISHLHTDHHAGLMGVLLAIKNAWSLLKKKPEKLFLLIPPLLIEWLEKYHNNFEPILENVTLVNLSDLSKTIEGQRKINTILRRAFGMNQIKVCWALHSAFSYCATFEHVSGWKISYSGDTEYSQPFAAMGQNSDLLIHEATYGTGLDHLAKTAKHSTTAHAINTGRTMRAKNVVLTHFSRRYPIIPCLKDLQNTSNVSLAFDFLQFTLSDLRILPKLNAAYASVFEDYENESLYKLVNGSGKINPEDEEIDE